MTIVARSAKYSTMKTLITVVTKTLCIGMILFAVMSVCPIDTAHASGADSSYFSFSTGTAETAFSNLQQRMKSLALIFLLGFAVFAAVMSAMGKHGWIIQVCLSAVVLFGLVYVLLLVSEGLHV